MKLFSHFYYLVGFFWVHGIDDMAKTENGHFLYDGLKFLEFMYE